MTITGKPAINPVKVLELTGVAAAISAARQRLEALEKEVNSISLQAGQSSLSASQSSASISDLQSQISVLRSRVDALSTDTDVQVFRADRPIQVNTAVYASSDGGVSQVSPGDPVAIYGVIGVAVGSAVTGANVSVRLRGTMQIVSAVFEPGGPVYVGVDGLTQFPDYINVAVPVGVAAGTDRLDVMPGWPALQSPGVYSEYETFLPATWGLVRDAVSLAADFNAASNGIVVRTGVDDITTRTLTAPAAGLTIGNASGASGNPTFALANDMLALEGLGSTGIAVRSATDTWVQRSIAPGAGIAVTNGSGVAGDPTVAIDATTLFANPTASVGLTAVNGSASTAMRSDAAPALDQGITPTWTGTHTFSNSVVGASFRPTSSSAPTVGMYLPAATSLGFTGVNFGFNNASPATFNQNQVGGVVIGDGTSSPGLTIFSSTTGLCAVSFARGTSGAQQYDGSFEYDQGARALFLRAASVRYLSVNQNGNGNVRLPLDNQQLEFGIGRDLQVYHDGTDSVLRNDTGLMKFMSGGTVQVQYDTTYFDQRTQVRKSGTLTPPQITANQNDYAPAPGTGVAFNVAYRLRINSDAARDITGLTGGADGRELFITNTGSFAITLKNASGSSTAANRFEMGADVILGSNVSVLIQYDGTSSRWRAA